ncbi:MAG: hypothetical protein K2Q01_06175 [Rickettsiales bacterium]|nr:hypothetical protein [Rickettsiales bacterium]
MATHDRVDQLKLYLIHKSHETFGDGSVSGISDGANGFTLYINAIPPGVSTPPELLKGFATITAQTFPKTLFGDDGANPNVKVGYSRLKHHGDDDEFTFKITLNGALTEMADNVEKKEGALFNEAQSSHTAEAVLRREKNRAIIR